MSRARLQVQASVARFKRERWVKQGGWAVLVPLVVGWVVAVVALLRWAR